MLNVALGGTLDQDAWTTFGPDRKITTILPKREICVEAATHLSLISGEQPMKVNALHSQAVDRLGQGLRVSARDTGGMVQAIERVRDPFALGVQWHPEHLFYAHRQRAIFRALVTAADAYRTDRNQTRAMRTEMA
jgi:putative glutamine amidotransferase